MLISGDGKFGISSKDDYRLRNLHIANNFALETTDDRRKLIPTQGSTQYQKCVGKIGLMIISGKTL